MYRLEKIMIQILVCFSIVFLHGCGYEPEYFSKEELSDYRSPVLFLSSKENDEKYFIMPDQPDKNEFKSIFYHFSDEQISGMYGADLFVYDMREDRVIYREELPEGNNGKICAWIDPQTYLYRPFFEIFEVCLDTGEMKEVESELAFGVILSADKKIGCSYGVEGEWWSPILVWDTTDYRIKQYKEGIVTGARIQISDDNKYIMFARINKENNQVLCIEIEDERLCTVYETTDYIFDLLW